LVMNTSSFMTF